MKLCGFLMILFFIPAAYGNLGFFPPGDPAFSKIKNKLGSIYQIWTPGGVPTNCGNNKFTENDGVEFLAPSQTPENIPKIQSTLNTKDIQKELIEAQLEECKSNHLAVCMIQKGLNSGSAFLLDSEKNLLTALHNFEPQIEAKKKNCFDSMKNPFLKLHFVLTNSSGKTVYSSRGQMTAEIINAHTYTDKSWSKYPTDYIALQLQTSLPFLKHATNLCPPENRVYGFGYPQATTWRKMAGFKDAPGDKLMGSRGVVLSLEQAQGRISNNRNVLSPDLAKQPLLFTNLDGEKGMSGGPILNTDGEVCGIILGASGTYTPLTFGVNFKN